MLNITKKTLFWSLIAISSITFTNLAILYWIPIDFPLTSYTALRTLFIAFVEKTYYLVPISFLICIFMFYTAFSFHKQQVILPAFLCTFLLYDSIALMCNFINSLYVYEDFIALHFVGIITNILVMVLMTIYFILLWKQKANNLR